MVQALLVAPLQAVRELAHLAQARLQHPPK
jgi:hypothetical protein